MTAGSRKSNKYLTQTTQQSSQVKEFPKTGCTQECTGDYDKTDDVLIYLPFGSLNFCTENLPRYLPISILAFTSWVLDYDNIVVCFSF